MVPFQCFADGNAQDGCKDDGNNRVEGGGGELCNDGGQRGSGGQALDQKTVIEIALGQIQDCVGQGADGGCQDGLDIAPAVLGFPNHQTHRQTVGTFGQEGDPAFWDVQRIGQIVNGGAQAGGQRT